MVLYIFRRRLGMSVEETRALPWWQRRLYLEGLDMEFGDDDTERVDGDLASLSGMGFTTGTV